MLLSLGAQVAVAKTTKKTSSASSKKKISSKSPKHAVKNKKVRARKGAWKRRGQQTIASERTVEIQEALIREGYLSGAPSGEMDESTKAALARFQTENGWQSKIVPDSRALIKLGLGPRRDSLINPNTAAYSTPADFTGAGTASQR
jgi:peptidoglycan hydrolase-like protein with peptidoglycan-binding domain